MKKNLQENISRIKTLMLIKEEEQIRRNYCKDKKEEIFQTFEEAKSWWVNWLQNPTFQQRFEIDFAFPKDEMDDLIKYLIEALSIIQFRLSRYIKNVYAWAGCKGACYVHHNCSREFEKKLHFTVYVHEIQHILNQILREDKDLQIDFSKKLNDVFEQNFNNFDGKIFMEKGKKIGIDHDSLTAMTKSINVFRAEKEIEQLNRPNEMMSRVVGVRNALGLEPGQDFTFEDLKSIIKNTNAFYIIAAIIATLKEGEDFNVKLQELLTILNSVAKSDGRNNLEIGLDLLPPELQSKISNIA